MDTYICDVSSVNEMSKSSCNTKPYLFGLCIFIAGLSKWQILNHETKVFNLKMYKLDSSESNLNSLDLTSASRFKTYHFSNLAIFQKHVYHNIVVRVFTIAGYSLKNQNVRF